MVELNIRHSKLIYEVNKVSSHWYDFVPALSKRNIFAFGELIIKQLEVRSYESKIYYNDAINEFIVFYKISKRS